MLCYAHIFSKKSINNLSFHIEKLQIVTERKVICCFVDIYCQNFINLDVMSMSIVLSLSLSIYLSVCFTFSLDGFSVTVTHSYCLPSCSLPKAMEVVGGGSQRGGDGGAAGGGEEEEETGPMGCASASASEGLEEGEVEGETLLIVEAEEQDHDQASLDLSHDQSGDSLNSEDAGEDADTSGSGWSEDTTAFHCEKCHKWIPSGEGLGRGGRGG